MKKYIIIATVALFLTSCGPKRMSCYGKRCVEISKKSALKNHQQTFVNS